MHLDILNQFVGVWTILVVAVTAVVHIGFAMAVHRDATRLGDRVMFVAPFLWAMGTLVGGVLSALAYWIIHYSSLSGPVVPNRAV
jgi:hypothetical protein